MTHNIVEGGCYPRVMLPLLHTPIVTHILEPEAHCWIMMSSLSAEPLLAPDGHA